MKRQTSSFIRIIILISLVVVLVFGAPSAQAARVTKVGMILLPEDNPGNIFLNNISITGFNKALEAYSLKGTLYPTTTYEFYDAIHQCAVDGNDLCIGLGFQMQDAILAVAYEYPSTKFTLNDVYFSGITIPSNTQIIVYNVRQAGYLAGVLSAYMTASGHLGVIGGMDIPPVKEFIEGYQNAVKCTNPQIQIEVVYANDFGNPDLGTTLAQQLMENGSDIIYPVAGSTGDGALIYATQNGAWGIGVDFDEYYSAFGGGTVAGADRLLTSTMKNFDKGIYLTISDLERGRFTGGYKFYGLKEGAVGLAPFHETTTMIPTLVKRAVSKAELDIIKGRINIYNPCW